MGSLRDFGDADRRLRARRPSRGVTRADRARLTRGCGRGRSGWSITAFYLLIRPTGGPLWGGLGNLVGLTVVTLAIVLRATSWVRYPGLAGHAMFHAGLPIAVGVPWGLLVLGLPACVATVLACRREERLRQSAPSDVAMPRRLLLPGIW